jgi:hypothetical protein
MDSDDEEASSIPSHADQLEIISCLMRTSKFEENRPAYVISGKWLNAWKRSVGFECESDGDLMFPIDNSWLFARSGDLREHEDYEVITQPVWEQLIEWFGGGPTIPREACRDPATGELVVPVIHPSFVVHAPGPTSSIFRLSLYEPVFLVKARICHTFKYDPDICRLREYAGYIPAEVLEDDKTLAEQQITRGMALLLEVPNANGLFPLVKCTKKKKNSLAGCEGIVGLISFDDSAFMNSVVQLVLCVDEFVQAFIAEKRGARSRVTLAVIDLLRRIDDVSSEGLVAPRLLREAIPAFRPAGPHDAHAFLEALMTGLRDETEMEEAGSVCKFFGCTQSTIWTGEDGVQTYRDSKTVFTLSIPLPRPVFTTEVFTFVPWDITEPRYVLREQCEDEISIASLEKALSKRFSRDIHVVIGEAGLDSPDVLWRPEFSRKGENMLYAFEIAGGYPVHVAVRLMASTPGWTEIEPGVFFLIGLSNDEPSRADILAACEYRFLVLVQDEVRTRNKRMQRIRERARSPAAEFQPNEIFRVVKVKPENRLSLMAKNVLTKRFDVAVNPQFVKDSFRWDLMNKVEDHVPLEVQENGRDIIALVDLFEGVGVWTEMENALELGMQAREVSAITGLPNVVFFKLGRFFEIRPGKVRKIERLEVEIPEEIDADQFAPRARVDWKYRLIGVVEHSGSFATGHYAAKAYRSDVKKWVLFNDEVVRETDPVFHCPYLLAYQRMR